MLSSNSLFNAAAVNHFHTVTNRPYILDDNNRARFFRGTNFVQKGWPWYPEVLLNETNVARLAELGFNTIRLGFMWTGAQPEAGSYNTTYYGIMKGIVETLAKYDIYAFLDVHQDVMSSYYCLYDAFPQWAVDQSRAPAHKFPWPLAAGEDGSACPSDRSWGRNYFSQACSTAFQTLYDPDTTYQKSFLDFWQYTADYFKDLPILGYEIINEPWAGDLYSDPTLLLPGKAGSKNLLPFYDIVSSKIREIDDKHLIFYEPVTWGMIFNGDVIGSGFNHTPNSRSDSSVFSFHYYCWWYSDPNNDLTRQTCDKLFGPKVFEQAIRETKEIGGATMLTEWGQGCNYDNENYNDKENECNVIMDLGDQWFVSWTDWYFGERLNQPSFPLTENARKLFGRIHARSIAGKPIQMKFDVESRSFDLCFEVLDEVTSSITELYVPFTIHYPNGVTIETSKNLDVVKVDEVNNRVLLRNRVVRGVEGEPMLMLNHACVHITEK